VEEDRGRRATDGGVLGRGYVRWRQALRWPERVGGATRAYLGAGAKKREAEPVHSGL
jgi:hypothetical protein